MKSINEDDNLSIFPKIIQNNVYLKIIFSLFCCIFGGSIYQNHNIHNSVENSHHIIAKMYDDIEVMKKNHISKQDLESLLLVLRQDIERLKNEQSDLNVRQNKIERSITTTMRDSLYMEQKLVAFQRTQEEILKAVKSKLD
jgi:hypothetical protein